MNNKLYITNRLIDDGECILYFAHIYQTIICINKVTGYVERVIPCNCFSHGYMRSFMKKNDNIILFPEGVGDIGKYNLVKDEIVYIKLPKELHDKTEDNWSANYYWYGDEIYFYWRDPVITVYNLISEKWQTLREWKKKVPKNIELEHWFYSNPVVLNDGLLFQLGQSRYIIKIDKQKDSHIHEMRFSSDISDVLGICFRQGIIWALCRARDGSFLIEKCDNTDLLIFEEEGRFQIDINGSNRYFQSMIITDQSLIFFPFYYDNALRFCFETGAINIIEDIPAIGCDELDKSEMPYNYLYSCIEGDYYWTINIQTGHLVRLSMIDSTIYSVPIRFDDDKLIAINTSMFKRSQVTNEGFMDLDLSDWIEYVTSN